MLRPATRVIAPVNGTLSGLAAAAAVVFRAWIAKRAPAPPLTTPPTVPWRRQRDEASQRET